MKGQSVKGRIISGVIVIILLIIVVIGGKMAFNWTTGVESMFPDFIITFAVLASAIYVFAGFPKKDDKKPEEKK